MMMSRDEVAVCLIEDASFEPASSVATSMPPTGFMLSFEYVVGDDRDVANTVVLGWDEYVSTKEAPRPREAPTMRILGILECVMVSQNRSREI